MASTPAELPVDILMLIFAGLEVPDLVRAGSVCSSWHGAYTSLLDLGRCKQQQTPCLLFTNKSLGASAAGIYSLHEKKQYRLVLPDPPIRSRHLIGAAHGWLITVDDRSELHLVNPVTGDQIALPSVTTISDLVAPVYDENGTLTGYLSYPALPGHDPPSIYGLSELRDCFFEKAFLSCDPSTGSYIVALIHNTYWQLSFARAGDDCWTRLSSDDSFADCVFKNKLLYAMTRLGGIHVFDFGVPAVEKQVVLENVQDEFYWTLKRYIVQAPSGDLLQIWELYGGDEVPQSELDRSEQNDEFPVPNEILEEPHCMYTYSAITYKLHRVDLAGKKRVEISSLDGNVLFLGLSQSICLHAEACPQLKANHIYFTDDDGYMICWGKNEVRKMGVVDLDNNTTKKIVYPWIWSNWPSPLWITPNPRKMTALLEVSSTARESLSDGKISSLSKVAVKKGTNLFLFIVIFIFTCFIFIVRSFTA